MQSEIGRKRQLDHTQPTTKKLKRKNGSTEDPLMSSLVERLGQPLSLPGSPLPPSSNLQTFPRETLAHILQYVANTRNLRTVCKRFNNVLDVEWNMMQKRKLGKMYIERIGDDSYLINITRRLEDSENLFEIEVDEHDIHISGPSGCFGMFGKVYKKSALRKISIFETDKRQVLAVVLRPIMKRSSFEKIEMDDISAETMSQLIDIINYTKSSATKLEYRRRPTQEEQYKDCHRPTGIHILELIQASRCITFSNSGFRPDLSFWKDGRMLSVSEILDNHGGRTEVEISEQELLERSYGKLQSNWNSELTVAGVQALIQAWQSGQKKIIRVVLRLSTDDQYIDITRFLGVSEGGSRNFYMEADLEKKKPLKVTLLIFYHEYDMGYISFEC